ncbi:MAG: ABC transporter substrate-binding protein [Clostridiales bacterium]|nr:ABC transporter substrate-binding protein [Clostridiales bacterium]
MKKIILLLALLTLSVAVLAGCKAKDDNSGKNDATENNETVNNEDTANKNETPGQDKTNGKIVVGASTTPHAEILEQTKEILANAGYELQIVEYSDYVQPNLALDYGDLDANYFQHQPYLDQFNEENGTNIVSVANIHYEPFGIYAGKTATVEELEEGAQIAVPNDTTNEARALMLLEAQGLITLAEGAGLNATIIDIEENPKNLQFIEIEAAQLTHSLQDVDMAVINGNYAIQDGLSPTDAIAIEDKESIGAETFGNVLAVKAGDEEREDIKALVDALMSDDIKQFINDTYKGAVVPQF